MKRILAALVTLLAPALAAAQAAPGKFPGLQMAANDSMPVCVSGSACIKYNSGTARLELSISGGAYSAFGSQTLAATYLVGTTTTDSIISLDSTRGPVIIRDSSPSSGSPLFAVQNNATNAFFSITPTSQQFIRSGVSNGASAVNLAVDTFNSFTNATSKILRVLTGGSERFAVTGPGNVLMIANSSLVVAAAATNTIAFTVTTDVAAGASSVGFKYNNTTALSTGTIAQFGDNSVARFQIKPVSTDGFQITDSVGTTAFVNISTNIGSVMGYGTAAYSAGSGSITITDGTNSWSMTGGVMTGQQLSMVPVNSSQTAATQAWRDSASEAHFGVDVYGLPSLGSRYEFRENWAWGGGQALAASQTDVNPTNSAGVWIYTSTANATGFINQTGFATGSPIVQGVTIGSGTANGNSTIFRMVSPIVTPAQLTNLEVVADFAVVVSATGANNATFKVGLTNGVISGANPLGWFFSKTSAQTNWQCVTDNGAGNTTTTDSGVASSTSAQQFRIEYTGSGTPTGLAVKFYINTALVCTNTTNVYTSNTVTFGLYNTATAATTQRTLSVGPVMLTYNQVASALIP